MTHVCWDSKQVKDFIGIATAESLQGDFFARHVPMTLNGAKAYGDGFGNAVRDLQYSEDDFLNEFLSAGPGFPSWTVRSARGRR